MKAEKADMGTISTMEKNTTGTPGAVTPGAAMDRIIEKKRYPVRWIAGAVAVLAVLLMAWYLLVGNSGRSLTVADSRIMLSPVVSGVFEDTIPVRARVAPLKTVFLDAVQGGRVEGLQLQQCLDMPFGVFGQVEMELGDSEVGQYVLAFREILVGLEQ